MRYYLVALDFDGTLAEDSLVPDSTVEVLERLRKSGRRLVMVSGRRLTPLLELCPWIKLFDRLVVENGAVLYNPATAEKKILATAPPPELVPRLRAEGVARIEAGDVVVATWRPHETAALHVIQELALDLQITFNKDAVMLLPSGCNKATGLRAALEELKIAPLNTIAVGDAENDEAMLRMVGVAVAVDNALEPVKRICDIVTAAPRGAGVSEVCEQILANDLADVPLQRPRDVVIGELLDGAPLAIPLHAGCVLVTGGPAAGKSRLAFRFLEQLQSHEAQVCIIDPEGDYGDIDGSIAIGTVERAPTS
jgi:HAD superfamily hydrolase (TIGR01484 family)